MLISDEHLWLSRLLIPDIMTIIDIPRFIGDSPSVNQTIHPSAMGHRRHSASVSILQLSFCLNEVSPSCTSIIHNSFRYAIVYRYYNGLISVTINYRTAGTGNHHDGDGIQSNPWDCTERIRFGSSRLPTDNRH